MVWWKVALVEYRKLRALKISRTFLSLFRCTVLNFIGVDSVLWEELYEVY